MNEDVVVIENSLEFESLINLFEKSANNIKSVFDKEKANVENINGTDVWTGDTQKVIYDKHVLLQKNFDPIVEALDYYVKFMRKVLSDYKALEQNINKNAEMNNEELNIN